MEKKIKSRKKKQSVLLKNAKDHMRKAASNIAHTHTHTEYECVLSLMEATHQSTLSTNLFPANSPVRHTEAGFEKYSMCVCWIYVNVFCIADINHLVSLQQLSETFYFYTYFLLFL